MGKELTLIFEEFCDFENVVNQVAYDAENGISFNARELNTHPEKAFFYREMFNIRDYVQALNKGIELANKGYTRVNLDLREE